MFIVESLRATTSSDVCGFIPNGKNIPIFIDSLRTTTQNAHCTMQCFALIPIQHTIVFRPTVTIPIVPPEKFHPTEENFTPKIEQTSTNSKALPHF